MSRDKFEILLIHLSKDFIKIISSFIQNEVQVNVNENCLENSRTRKGINRKKT